VDGKHGSSSLPAVKILDFGLARFASETRSAGNLTQIGRIVGTVDYISPEQAGDPRKADIRSDIYSLGCCLFYLLTGRPPFEGPDMVARIAARVLGDAPSLRAWRPDAPAALEQVLARMLARDPQQRFGVPAEVATALESFARTQVGSPPAKAVAVAVAPAVAVERVRLQAAAPGPISAPGDVFQVVSPTEPLIVRKSARAGGGNWGWAAAAGVAVVLLGGGGAYWIFRQPKAEPPNQGSTQPLAVNDRNPRVRSPERTADAEAKLEPKPETRAPDPTSPDDPKTAPPPPPNPQSKPAPAPADPKPAQPKPMAEPEKPKNQRRRVPEGAALAKAEAGIRELYKDEYKKVKHSEMSSFAERLLEEAGNVSDDVATLYVLMNEARDVAARAADAALAFKAIDELAARFVVDGETMKIAALERAVREAHTPERTLLLADMAKDLVEEAASTDRYSDAVRLAKLAENAALRSGDRALIASTMARRKDLEILQKAFEDLKPAVAVLADKPDDANANLAMGRFLCLQKGDWTQGLPHLVQCNDERLKELAGKELGGLDNAQQEAELADAWREQARKERGLARNQMMLHAMTLLQKTLPELAGMAKLKAEKSLAQIEKELPSEYHPEPPGARFKGRWLVPYPNRVLREYVIDAKGNVEFLREGTVDAKGKVINPREVKRSAKVIKQGNDYLLDFEDGALERLYMKGGNLVVERFEPKARYPKGRPSLVATSVRKP
jgi:hypothetical protein